MPRNWLGFAGMIVLSAAFGIGCSGDEGGSGTSETEDDGGKGGSTTSTLSLGAGGDGPTSSGQGGSGGEGETCSDIEKAYELIVKDDDSTEECADIFPTDETTSEGVKCTFLQTDCTIDVTCEDGHLGSGPVQGSKAETSLDYKGLVGNCEFYPPGSDFKCSGTLGGQPLVCVGYLF
jgi:hypothetical protein